MNTMVIYDSYFGNTKLIAEKIAQEFGGDAILVFVSDFKLEMLNGVNLVILGSPIRGWKPTERTESFLANLPLGTFKDIKAATFDTRVRLFFHGDAAKVMANKLTQLGAQIIVPPHSFDVEGKEGPLYEGEIEKAIEWAKSIKKVV